MGNLAKTWLQLSNTHSFWPYSVGGAQPGVINCFIYERAATTEKESHPSLSLRIKKLRCGLKEIQHTLKYHAAGKSYRKRKSQSILKDRGIKLCKHKFIFHNNKFTTAFSLKFPHCKYSNRIYPQQCSRPSKNLITENIQQSLNHSRQNSQVYTDRWRCRNKFITSRIRL